MEATSLDEDGLQIDRPPAVARCPQRPVRRRRRQPADRPGPRSRLDDPGLALQLGQIAEQGLVSEDARRRHPPERQDTADGESQAEEEAPAEEPQASAEEAPPRKTLQKIRTRKRGSNDGNKSFDRGLDRGAERHLGPGTLRADQSARGGVRRLRDRGGGGCAGSSRRRRPRPAAARRKSSTVDVVLTEVGGQKVPVIKVVRAATGSWPERGQGTRRRRSRTDQRGRRARGGRQAQSGARGGWRDGRAQIEPRALAPRIPVRGAKLEAAASPCVIFRGRAPFEYPCPYLRFIYVPLTARGVADFGTF